MSEPENIPPANDTPSDPQASAPVDTSPFSAPEPPDFAAATEPEVADSVPAGSEEPTWSDVPGPINDPPPPAPEEPVISDPVAAEELAEENIAPDEPTVLESAPAEPADFAGEHAAPFVKDAETEADVASESEGPVVEPGAVTMAAAAASPSEPPPTAPPPAYQPPAYQPPAYQPEQGGGPYANADTIQVIPGQHSTGIAILLAILLPGAGQMYNKQVNKGVAFLLGYLALFGVVTFIAVITCFIGSVLYVLLTPVPIVGIVDAYKIADRLNRGEVVRKWQWF